MAPLTGSTSVKSYALRGACRQWRGFADAGSDRQLGHIAWSAGVLDSALALPPWLGHHIMSSVLAQGSARRALQSPMNSFEACMDFRVRGVDQACITVYHGNPRGLQNTEHSDLS